MQPLISNTSSLKLIYFINLIPFGLLVYAFSISDFTILNVVENSYVDDPIFYKVTSAWGSHEGSILLWVFLINLFGVFFLYKNQTVEIHKNILFISTLFVLYIIISSNPFKYVEANENILGLGLNPILQHFSICNSSSYIVSGIYWFNYSLCYICVYASK